MEAQDNRVRRDSILSQVIRQTEISSIMLNNDLVIDNVTMDQQTVHAPRPVPTHFQYFVMAAFVVAVQLSADVILFRQRGRNYAQSLSDQLLESGCSIHRIISSSTGWKTSRRRRSSSTRS